MTEQRVAIVTGGSRGIGRAVARRLAQDGLAVTVGYTSRPESAAEVVAEIEAAGGEAIAVGADVGDDQDVARLFAETTDRFGGVDAVVNAAGVMKLAPVAELELAVLDETLRTNLRGAFLVSQAAARALRPGGALINFSSTVTRTRFPNYAIYAATKTAVETMTSVLAKELRGRDVTVNTVAPGPTATELFLTGKDEATIERLRLMNPFERLGQPEDIAEVVSALVGRVRWVNGQTIFANAGMA